MFLPPVGLIAYVASIVMFLAAKKDPDKYGDSAIYIKIVFWGYTVAIALVIFLLISLVISEIISDFRT